jgi:hypothetical protein
MAGLLDGLDKTQKAGLLEGLAELYAGLESAAARQRRSVRGGRREGTATALLDAVGSIPMQMVGAGKNMMDAAYTHPMGTSVADNPQYTGLVAENALNVVGLPALTGGVPAGAIAHGAARRGSRNRMIENADESRQAALEKRNEGRGSTNKVYATTAQMEKARGGGPEKGSIEYDIEELVSRISNTRKEGQNAVERALFPEQFPTVYDTPASSPQELFARQADPDAFFSNFTDRKTGGGILGANNLPEQRQGIRAYHGSPHDFDRFDMSKIGTGEGAQAYGHGLYFAENPKVAEEYKQALSRRNVTGSFDGAPLNEQRDWWATIDKVNQEDWRVGKLLDQYGRVGGSKEWFVNQARTEYRDQPQMLKAIDDFDKRMVASHRPGKMYEVNINAAPEQFLDWDRPLKEQPEHIRGVLDPINGRLQSSGNPYVPARLDSVGDVIQHGRAALGERGIEPSLRKAGIPGIKYLDQGSRGFQVQTTYKGQPYSDPIKFDSKHAAEQWAAEQRDKGFGADINQAGTSNYVVFDDKLIDILKKYGLLGGMTGGSGLLASGDEQ